VCTSQRTSTDRPQPQLCHWKTWTGQATAEDDKIPQRFLANQENPDDKGALNFDSGGKADDAEDFGAANKIFTGVKIQFR
jgi:hypothetical protein